MTGRKSIRQRLTAVFVFLAIGPLILVGLFLSWQVYETQKNEAIQLQKEISKRVISELSLVSEELVDDFVILALATNLLNKEHVEQRVIMDFIQSFTFRKNKNVFSAITLLDISGQEQVKVSLTKVYTVSDMQNRSNDQIFLVPFNEKKIFYGPVKEENDSHESIIEMSVPLVDKWTGNVNAVLVIAVKLNHLWDSVIEEGISGKVSVFITSENGVVVAHDDPSILMTHKGVNVPVEGELVKGFDDFKSVRLAEPFTLGSQRFYLVCDYHIHDAYLGVIHSLSIVAVFVISFLCVSLMVAYRMVSPIVRHIEDLGNVSKLISEGDYKIKAVESGEDEVAFLGKAINTMTSQLVGDIDRRKKAEEALLHAQHNLEEKVALRTEELSLLNLKLRGEIEEKEIAENALRQAQEELESRVAVRTEELDRVNRTLKSEIIARKRLAEQHEAMHIRALAQNKLATLGEVATGVAHEMNQPLSYIKIIFEAAFRDLNNGALNHGEFLEECQESLKQLRRITLIIDHLRTFGRSDAITSMLEVDLAIVWENSLIIFRERIRNRNVTLKEDFGEDITICGNSLKLEQLFVNLLQNSLDALKSQGSGEIHVCIKKDNHLVVINFLDTGVGISKEVIERMFEPFYTTKPVGEGTGLGLSIAYGIVRDHGGSISCHSQEGHSTEFTISFPHFSDPV